MCLGFLEQKSFPWESVRTSGNKRITPAGPQGARAAFHRESCGSDLFQLPGTLGAFTALAALPRRPGIVRPMSHVRRLAFLGLLTGAALSAVSLPAIAQVKEPQPFTIDVNGKATQFQEVPIDQANSGDYFSDSYTVDVLGLGALFKKYEQGKVDYQKDASLEPATFSPLCGLQGSLLVRGGACRMDFGWYCVDDPKTVVPIVTSKEVIAFHEKIKVGLYSKYYNTDAGFVPNLMTPPVKGAALSDIQNDPVFQKCKSKQIGFAIVPTMDPIPSVGEAVCTQQKFSEARLNTKCTATGTPWVTALTYASKTQPGVFYIAFEDMPQEGGLFNPLAGKTKWKPDADFNDFVYKVEGLVCEGGGQFCKTGKPGVCAVGVTDCTKEKDVEPDCRQSIQPSPEVCDNQDNDCNGVVDDGDGLCAAGLQCNEGKCQGPCSNSEFPCSGGMVCDQATSLCVEKECVGVVCTGGQICRGGVCQGGCEGVVCPTSQTCMLGRCIDPCVGIQCPDSFVCDKGACVADCKCLPCANGLKCENGRCVDPACNNVVCEGDMVCNAGKCVDPCAGISCPGGQTCSKGACISTGAPTTTGTTGSIINPTTGTTGLIISTGSPSGASGAAGASASTSVTDLGAAKSEASGCSCRVTGSGSSGAGLLGLILGLGIFAARRRR